jgi:hypothetical protein
MNLSISSSREGYHSRWIRNGFSRSTEGSQGCESGKVVGSSLSHEQGAPHEDIPGQVISWWAPLHDQVGGYCPSKPSEVEDTTMLVPFHLPVLTLTARSTLVRSG